MFKDSIKTTFKNPKLMLMYMLPSIVAITAIFYSADMGDKIRFLIRWAQYQSRFLFMLTSVLSGGFLYAVFIQFVYFPILYNYTNEMVRNDVQKGWIKRGLKKKWWRVFAVTVISYTPYCIVYILSVGLLFLAMFSRHGSIAVYVIMAIMFIVITMVLLSYYSVFLVTAIAEDNFGTAMKNAFRIGKKNFLIIMLINFVLFCIGLIGGLIRLRFDGVFDVFSASANTGTIMAEILFLLILALIIGISSFFAYVYITKLYYERIPVLEQKDAERMQLQQSAPEAEQ